MWFYLSTCVVLPVSTCLPVWFYLSRLYAQVMRLLAKRLNEEAVLPLIHVLALLHHAEHRLEHLDKGHVLYTLMEQGKTRNLIKYLSTAENMCEVLIMRKTEMSKPNLE